MSLLEPDTFPVREARLGRWFFYSGLFGIVVGLVLLFIHPLFDALGDAALVIFPSSIMGLAEPQTKSDIAFLLSMEMTSQFILYGMLGLVVGVGVYWVRRLSSASY